MPKLPKRLRTLRRTVDTLRHLTLRQAFFYVWRRGIGARPAPPVAIAATARVFAHDPLASAAVAATSAPRDATLHSFTFLNQTLDFPVGRLDWSPANASRLWRYNLHYFDFLQHSDRTPDEKRQLVQHWIDHNPPGSEPGWEPYTASLRIVNWCRFFWSQPVDTIPESWRRSLQLQIRWLERNLEYHILANHLFENIKALVFGGAFFEGGDAARWLRIGQRLLREQLIEQQLPDGGHYERSPQYHCILLDDYFDLYALAQAAPGQFDATTVAALRAAIAPALRLLAGIATPDDDIPLFNDSASGVAPRPSALRQRAQLLGIDFERPAIGSFDYPDTGLYGWKSDRDYFAIDCGDIGPAYQPGHTHCDFLSYVLMQHGQWLIVDSGVYEYEAGAMRHYVRSTAAHNTVAVDGREQSEVWAEFRVGRRARRIGANLVDSSNGIVFEGEYRGFFQGGEAANHRRRATVTVADTRRIQQLRIEDTITMHGAIAAQSFIHLHHELQATVEGNRVQILRGSATVAILQLDNAVRVEKGSSWYCPEFGIRHANTVLTLHAEGNAAVRFGYSIDLIDT